MKAKQFLCPALGVVLLGSTLLAGCGDQLLPYSVVIYTEYNGAIGSEDNVVKKAIEEKFLADTGYQIDLRVEATNTDTVGQKVVTAISDGNSQIDAFAMHYGADSNINSYILDGITMELDDMMDEYAPHFKASFNQTTDPSSTRYNSGVLNGKLYAVSEKSRTTGWGMLIRKDYMEKTSFAPDDYDVTKTGHKSLSVDDFVQMVREMKENTAVTRPIVGAPWSLDYFFTPAYSTVSYNDYVLDENDNLIPAYATENYCKIFELYRMFQEEKLWIESPESSQNNKNYFISGKGAVYLDWPEITSQLDVARSLKEARGVECIVVEPLLKVGSESETNGNARINPAFTGMAFPKKSKNYELVLRYLDWLYSDVENYELAKYGIENTHWVKIDNEQGAFWDYPADKKDRYTKNMPYSGKYCLVEDYFISDRTYNDYDATEIDIINKVRAFKSYPENGCVTDGMILPKVPAVDRNLVTIEKQHFDDYITNVRAKAWSDAGLNGKSIAERWQSMHDNLMTKYIDLVNFNTENYKNIINNNK